MAVITIRQHYLDLLVNTKKICNILSLIFGVLSAFSIIASCWLTNITVILMLLFWLGSGVKEKLSLIVSCRSTYAILGFLLCYLIGTIGADAQQATVFLVLHKMSRLLLIPIVMSLFSEKKWRITALYSFWLGIFVGCFAVVLKNFYIVSELPSWISIPFKDRIFTSMFFCVATFSLLHYGFEKEKILFYFLAIICAFYLFFLCDGRSGQFILLALLNMFFLQRKFSVKVFMICNLIFFIFIGITTQVNSHNKSRYILTFVESVDFLNSKFINSNNIIINKIRHNEYLAQKYRTLKNKYQNNERKSIDQQCTGLRLEFWYNSLLSIKKKPILGYGTGSFRHVYETTYPLFNKNLQQIKHNNPHNQYVLTTFELGIIGLLLLLTMFAVLFYECKTLPSFERYLAQGLIITLMIGCLVNSWLMDFTSSHFFAYMLGICFGARKFSGLKS